MIFSLYVGDLKENITPGQLYDKFSTIGQISAIHVCRSRTTGRSLQYGYVNYEKKEDAQRAIDTFNCDELQGQPMRVMWSQKDPSLRKSGVSNVFIKHLHKYIDAKVLYTSFLTFGNILSCKVARDQNGLSKGYGFVQFEKEESALACIEKINGQLINDKKVFVGPFIRKENRQKELENKRYTNVYIKNIEKYFSDKELYELFANFGTIISAKVMLNENGSSKGFGFVSFKEPEQAEKAVIELNGRDNSEGKKYHVERAQKKSERQYILKQNFEKRKIDNINRRANLYVKYLDDTIDDKSLHELFSVFGTITSAKVMMMSNARSKNYGFVCFSSSEEANKAITEMHGRIVGKKPIYVAFAQRKEDRKVRLSSNKYLSRNVYTGTEFPPCRVNNNYIESTTQIPRFYDRSQYRFEEQDGQIRNYTTMSQITKEELEKNNYSPSCSCICCKKSIWSYD